MVDLVTDWRLVDWSPFVGDPARAGLLSDFDGTLSAVVADRDQAVPVPGAADALSALSAQWALVAVVSGRPVRFLERHFSGLPHLAMVGVHGLERATGDHVSVLPEAEKWRPVVAEVAGRARRDAPRGVEVEDKGVSMVLHSRRVPSTFSWAMSWARAQEHSTGLVARRGRLSVELLPPVAVDKGSVAEELGVGLQALCYLGDDVSDLSAFAALRRLSAGGKTTVAVGVSSAEQPDGLAEAVDLLLSGPAEAVALLEALSRMTSADNAGPGPGG